MPDAQIILVFSLFILNKSLTLQRILQRMQHLIEINEALCSSCTLKPRKFQVQQENMMASARKRGMLSASSVQGIPRTAE